MFVIRRLPLVKLDNMSDINEEQFLQNYQSTNRNQNSTPNDALQNAPKDILDAFQLFKQYMDVKVDKLETKLIDAQDLVSKNRRRMFQSSSSMKEARYNTNLMKKH
jgi:hypothetical protein